MRDRFPREARLDRLQLAAVAIPLAYIVILVLTIGQLDLPSWEQALLATVISLPLVGLFAYLVFRVVQRAQATLILRERRFRGLIEAAPDAIVIVDEAGKIVIVNGQTTKLFGYAPQELLGQRVELLLPERLREAHVGHRADYQRAPGIRPMGSGLNLVARRKDGTAFPVEISLSPIETDEGTLVTSVIRDITERKRAEDTLRETNDILRGVTEGTTDAVYVKDLDLRYLMINTAGARMLGKPVDEIIGRRDDELFTPETAGSIMEADREIIADGETRTFEEVGTAAGVTRTFLSTKGTYRDGSGNVIGIIGISRDITERKQAEEQLRESEERFRLLIDGIRDYAIFMLDPGGRAVSWNASAERIMGYTTEEIIGRHVSTFHPPDEAALGMPAAELHEAARDGRHEAEGWRVRKDGTRYLANVVTTALRYENGDLRGFSKVVRDITERRRMEAEHERLLVETEAERERQRIGMDLHDGVIQSIYAVGLGLEAAVEDVRHSPEDAGERIDRAIEQLNGVIRDIRSYIFELRPTRFSGDLADSLKSLAQEFRVNSLIETTARIANDLPALEADVSIEIFQIAQEALNNVRKHSRARSVEMTLEQRDGTLHFEVCDDGTGFNTSAHRTADHRGLRNMSSRAEKTGGTFSIESSPEAGTRISLDIPLSVVAGERR